LPSARGIAEGYDLGRVIGHWQSVAHGSFRDDCRALKKMITETDELRLWEKNIGGFRYASRDEFLRKQVLIDYELTERDMTEIVAMLKRDDYAAVQRQLAQHLAADPGVKKLAKPGEIGRGRTKDRVANSHSNQLSSDSAERIVRRLKRDAPEIAEALGRGEFKSARAAGIAAGIIRPPTPFEQVCKLLDKLTPDELLAVHHATDPHHREEAAE
jgi:hypothetical protein